MTVPYPAGRFELRREQINLSELVEAALDEFRRSVTGKHHDITLALSGTPRPVRATVGGAVFRNEPTVERQFEVIDPVFFEAGWMYRGLDVPLEQEIIRRLKKCM